MPVRSKYSSKLLLGKLFSGILLAVLAVLVLAIEYLPTGTAQSLPDDLTWGGSARVVEVIDGDTVVLDNGEEIRLVGIQAPKLPLGRKNFPTWPLADKAKEALEALTLGRTIDYGHGGTPRDRHGRLLAHIYDQDGTWAQGEILAQGMARVYSFPDNRALVDDMLALERAARDERRGIWDHPFYAVRTPEEAADFINGFELVEGKIHNAAIVRGRAYLNFGTNWREDFTVTFGPSDLRRIVADGVDLTRLEGQRVRVRGWLKSFNGPMIEATHMEQIELLDD